MARETAPYGEIIPSWFAKTFDNFFAWIPNIEIPDARADMVAAFGTDSPANIWSVSDAANIDDPLAAAIANPNFDEAKETMDTFQRHVLGEVGQHGRHIAYNYIVPGLRWNYFRDTGPEEGVGWNFLATTLNGLEEWLDPSDPTWEGRATAVPTPV